MFKLLVAAAVAAIAIRAALGVCQPKAIPVRVKRNDRRRPY